jgi:hypothetical protein
MSITGIVSNLIELGANVTARQKKLLEWRTSDAAKKYYSEEENIRFYKELKKGNMDVVDAIRKEKQKRINDLKRRLLRLILISLCLFVYGCGTIPIHEKSWDVNSLQEDERTFQIKEQEIAVDGKFGKVKFDAGWYVVSEDFIKTFNENQDSLLEILTEQDEKKKKSEQLQTILIYSGLGIAGIISLAILIAVIKRRKK